MNPAETIETVRSLYRRGDVDYVDVSLWDVKKASGDAAFPDPLISYFTAIEGRGMTRLCVSGKMRGSEEAQWALSQGADCVAIGRAAIIHHDFPRRAIADPSFVQAALP